MGADAAALRERYGPWALITGASDGTGAAYARELARAGLNLVLISRRIEPLQALADELAARFKVKTKVASIDLYQPGAAAQVLAAAEGAEVGLYVSNAGADTNGKPFLDAPFAAWRDLIHRNVLNMAETVYNLAGPMKARGRGGIVLMSSGTALGGQAGVGVYSATKAFDLNLGESLWMELAPHGIDVTVCVAPAMDTPSLRKVLEGRQIPGIFDPAEVARQVLGALGERPTQMFGFGPGADQVEAQMAARRDRIVTVSNMTRMFFGDG